jgi:hypothetical protein
MIQIMFFKHIWLVMNDSLNRHGNDCDVKFIYNDGTPYSVVIAQSYAVCEIFQLRKDNDAVCVRKRLLGTIPTKF